MNTHKLSMGKAAKETGVSKTTIHNAIKSGKLSAPKVDGQYEIDPSELFRVFDPVTPGEDKQGEPPNSQVNPQIEQSVTAEVNAYKQLIDQLKDRLEEKDERITEYKTTIQKTENLLSDQRSESEKAKAAKAQAEEERARAMHHVKQTRPIRRKLTLKERIFGGEIEVVSKQQ